jgi:hypothetical protein
VKGLPDKLKDLCDCSDAVRLSILPGSTNIISNTIDIIKGNQKHVEDQNDINDLEEYQARLMAFRVLGESKVHRFEEYWRLFPELTGCFAFIGDDGQADMLAADAMLSLRDDDGQPLIAFCAIGAVRPTPDTYIVPAKLRLMLQEKLNRKHGIDCRDVPSDRRWLKPTNPAGDTNQDVVRYKARFFYFEDYGDLAQQLFAEGWITEQQRAAIVRAFDVGQSTSKNDGAHVIF